MSFSQRSTVLILTLFLFIGTVGVNVFEHICKVDGVSVSYIVNSGEDQCGKHHDEQKVEKKQTCCHKKESNEDKGCCSNDVEYIKLKIDTDTHDDEKIVVPLQLALIAEPIIISNDFNLREDYYTANYINPPPIDSRRNRIKKQVWII